MFRSNFAADYFPVVFLATLLAATAREFLPFILRSFALKASSYTIMLFSLSLITMETLVLPVMAQQTAPAQMLVAQSGRGQLTTWSFAASSRVLELRTSQGVQPRARLISNPTRLVIDLPGISLGRPPVSQPLTNAFQVLRLGQFDPSTARVVVQLDPGYTLDPNQVRFRGIHPAYWTVQLPTPTLIPPQTPSGSSSLPSVPRPPDRTIDNSNDSTTGYDRFSRIRGSNPWGPSANTGLPLIESIDYSANRSQLIIQGSRPLIFTNGWDRATGAYRISLAAQPIAGLSLPPTGVNTPFLRIQMQREGENTVLLLLPTANTRIQGLSPINGRQLVLELGTSRFFSPPPIATQPAPGTPDEIPIPVPPPISATIPSTLPQAPVRPLPGGSNPTVPRSRYVVVIDPGHGGPDPGAVGIGGIQEKDIVIDISRQVAARLQQQGISVTLTRSDDRDLDLEPRVQIAERVNATIFVSIHANAISLSRPEVNGLETFYYASAASGQLASAIHRNVLRASGSRDRGVRTARFYVLRQTSMPSALVEVGFVTGQEDAPRLATRSHRTLLADSIARGILEYLQNSR